MQVFGQYLFAYLDTSKSMFDFSLNFFIQDPRDSNVECFYFFDKIAKRSKAIEAKERKLDEAKSDLAQMFKGSIDHPTTIERRPFKFNGLTGAGMGISVDAQVKLVSSEKDLFTVEVSLKKKKDFAVNVRFEGAAPSWLSGGKLFDGVLMRGEVKDLSPPKQP